jgi:RHS repeat-associated protein
MHTLASHSSLLVRFINLIICYSVAISAISPFVIHSANATSLGSNNAGKVQPKPPYPINNQVGKKRPSKIPAPAKSKVAPKVSNTSLLKSKISSYRPSNLPNASSVKILKPKVPSAKPPAKSSPKPYCPPDFPQCLSKPKKVAISNDSSEEGTNRSDQEIARSYNTLRSSILNKELARQAQPTISGLLNLNRFSLYPLYSGLQATSDTLLPYFSGSSALSSPRSNSILTATSEIESCDPYTANGYNYHCMTVNCYMASGLIAISSYQSNQVNIYVDGVKIAESGTTPLPNEEGRIQGHAFSVDIHQYINNGQPHQVKVTYIYGGREYEHGTRTVYYCGYDGSFDYADCNTVWGWAWIDSNPNTPIYVDLYADGVKVVSNLADVYRSDLPDYMGNKQHGFSISLPDHLRDGREHNLDVRIAGTNRKLKRPDREIAPHLYWSYMGPIPGKYCTLINEPGDPDGWHDNYLCTDMYYEPAAPGNIPYLDWSYAGKRWIGPYDVPIERESKTIQINEGSDPHSWGDNYLFIDPYPMGNGQPSRVKYQWSPAGPIPGKECIQINEPSDPHAWGDNYLCWDSTYIRPITSCTIPNKPPIANPGGPYTGIANQAIQFNGSGSHDPDGSITSYLWNFGDGTTATTANPTHVYTTANTYTATLTVTDNQGATDSKQTTVTVAPVPKPTPNLNDFSVARLDPRNQTGGLGNDPGSQNINWQVPLLSLPGRAGLDLGLSLVYNSLVWTRSESAILFDADHGYPSPGFRLGFPIIQRKFFNKETGMNAYLLITSTGQRVELRQSPNNSNVFESADGSYMRMTEYNNGSSALLEMSDGTRLSFTLYGNDLQCRQIKDRNGNYITIEYNSSGSLSYIIDTVGRRIDFKYDDFGYNRLTEIVQTISGTSHRWAYFGYTNLSMKVNFPNMQVFAPGDLSVSVLNYVSTVDGSFYTFDYNSWGQVYKIIHHSQGKNVQDSDVLSTTSYNLPLDNTTAQTDCPRFSAQFDSAANWNGGEPAVTSYKVATDSSWSEVMDREGIVYKSYYATSGWQKGLVTKEETIVDGNVKKTLVTKWTQDDTSKQYQINPRVEETDISDSDGNRLRTTFEYYDTSSFSLRKNVRVYGGANGNQLLKRSYIIYQLDPAYTSKRIVGLVKEQYLYEGESNLVSKNEYSYDAGGANFITTAPSVQYDSTNFPSTYIVGRGNLTAIRRFDADHPDDQSKAIWVKRIGYNMAGSQVFAQDAEGNKTQIEYTDSFSDGVNRNTLAYPTKLIDADNYASTVQYDYRLGKVTYTKAPKGAEVETKYDSAGRPTLVTNKFNGAYKQFVYPESQDFVQTFETVQSINKPIYSLQVLDGGGRVRSVATELPGSAGGYSGQQMIYDVMGRLIARTNPAETSASGSEWVTTGDDADTGWQWSQTVYDWKGRPTKIINTDNSETNPSLQEITYTGCGCVGGEIAEVKDERGRVKRLKKDVLGRLAEVNELNWDGTTDYSTTTYEYNGRDQLTKITQAGVERSRIVYDGHGRLYEKTSIEQGTNTYTYYNNDQLYQSNDARGVTTTYTYNKRGLVTGISYNVPTGVEATSNVVFGYDVAGNREWMTDRHGRVDYEYNTLSQMLSETRQFDALGSSYKLEYNYNIGGALTKIKNPWGGIVNYNYDGAGRVISVTGEGFQSATTYISGLQYRAFGGMKAATYGNGKTLSTSYDTRLRMTSFNVNGVLGSNYSYTDHGENGGRVTYAQNLYDSTLDRSHQYDQVGRLVASYSGTAARAHIGQAEWPAINDGPYWHLYEYDKWGNQTKREGEGGWNAAFTASYNDKNQLKRDPATGALMEYDASGNMVYDGYGRFTYFGTGQQASVSFGGTELVRSEYDGDGQRVKKIESGETTYYLRSSVLGGKTIAEVSGSGGFKRGYVKAGGAEVVQEGGSVLWIYSDPVTKQKVQTNASGEVVSIVDVDPWGGETSRSVNQYSQRKRYTSYERDDSTWIDEAGARSYGVWWSRFMQPDPFDGSMDMSNPQSFNRYAYVGNDPVNRIDPTGLDPINVGTIAVEHITAELSEIPWWLSGLLRVRSDYSPTPESAMGSKFRELILAQPVLPTIYVVPASEGPTKLNSDDLRKDIKTLLDTGDCGSYIKSLIEKTAELYKDKPYRYNDILQTFDKIAGQEGYWTVPNLKVGDKHAGGGMRGAIDKGTAMVEIMPADANRIARMWYALSAIHETIHFSGSGRGYTDEQLAMAASQLPGAGPGLPAKGTTDSYAWSGYWDGELNRHCANRQKGWK